MIALDAVTPAVILAGLLGAVAWGLITWWVGLPTSSSHALLGGYAGAAMANSVLRHGWSAATSPIIATGWNKTLLFIVLAPVIGFILAYILMMFSMAAQRRLPPQKADKIFGLLQLFSSAFLSLMHGGNDAQKTAGIITGALVAAGMLGDFTVPYPVLCASYAAMGLGTFFGGWRIVRTMGEKLTRLRPNGGFCAETSAAISILTATLLHLPVSTTHATTGAILGVGAARRIGGVRWNIAGNILWAWLLTIPAAAAMGVLTVLCIHFTGTSN
jgi:PiT family inorganic phosphate transporter